MDEGTVQHDLDPEVRLGNEKMQNTSTVQTQKCSQEMKKMHDTEMKLGLDENWKNRSPKKEGTLPDQGLSWNTTSLVVSFS